MYFRTKHNPLHVITLGDIIMAYLLLFFGAAILIGEVTKKNKKNPNPTIKNKDLPAIVSIPIGLFFFSSGLYMGFLI